MFDVFSFVYKIFSMIVTLFTGLVSFVFSVPSFHVMCLICISVALLGFITYGSMDISYTYILIALIVVTRLGDRPPEALSPIRLGHKSESPSRVGV